MIRARPRDPIEPEGERKTKRRRTASVKRHFTGFAGACEPGRGRDFAYVAVDAIMDCIAVLLSGDT
eukprot:1745168-Prymnesium_polylepis.1